MCKIPWVWREGRTRSAVYPGEWLISCDLCVGLRVTFKIPSGAHWHRYNRLRAFQSWRLEVGWSPATFSHDDDLELENVSFSFAWHSDALSWRKRRRKRKVWASVFLYSHEKEREESGESLGPLWALFPACNMKQVLPHMASSPGYRGDTIRKGNVGWRASTSQVSGFHTHSLSLYLHHKPMK